MRSFICLLVFTSLSFLALAAEEHVHGENCGCAHKKPKPPAFIEDADEVPPEMCDAGFFRYIPDPTSTKPSDWDEEDDGPWQSNLIENPAYSWRRKLIPNPEIGIPAQSGYWSKLVAEVNEAIPWVTLGVILVSIFSVLPLPLELIRSHLNGEGVLSAFKAGILGLATPLCSCGSLPIAAGFIEHGVPLSSVVAFLTASQSAGLDSAVITYGLLGPTATACRLMGALVLSVVAGTVLRSSSTGKHPTKREPISTAAKNSTTPGRPPFFITRMASTLVDTAADIYPLLLLGLAISTAAIHFIPMLTAPFEAMKEHKRMGDFLLRMGVITSALPLQLCEHSTAALAAGIQEAGGGAGLAFAFLLSAPATNLPSLLLLAKSAGSYNRFTPFKVALSLTGTALFLSYCVDFAEVDLLIDKEAKSGGEMAALPSSFIKTCPYISGLLLAIGVFRKIRSSWTKEEDCACPPTCEKKTK